MLKSHYDHQSKIIDEHWKIMRYEVFQLLNIQMAENDRLKKPSDLFYLDGEQEIEEKQKIEKYKNTDWDGIERKMDEISEIINKNMDSVPLSI